METITLEVRGMTCMGCVASLRRVLEALPGVSSAEVTLTPARAIVRHDPARTGARAIRDAIRDAGYDSG